jgi:hypothetical protein
VASRHLAQLSAQARWQAHCWLEDGENPEQIKGKWSLDIDLHAATRKPRRGGWEGSAHGTSASAVARVSTEKRHRRGAKGVAEAAEEVVREELLGGAELAVGSVGWGNN